MSEDVAAALLGFLLALLIVVGGPLLYRAWHQRQLNSPAYQRAWQWLAARTGLTYEPGPYSASPRLVGAYRGRALTLNLSANAGRLSRTFTRLHLALRHPVPGRLSLARRGGLAALWPRPADDFPGRYRVVAEPQTLGQAVLASASLKRKLLQAQVRIELDPDGLRLLAPGLLADPEYLAFLFDLLSETARLLENAQPRPVSGASTVPVPTLLEA
ncbi:MAG: hypothetical protein IT317_09495 [Anaerolineales bacterium]|nr:hypothetical protein [Anaerolineales bacterium]